MGRIGSGIAWRLCLAIVLVASGTSALSIAATKSATTPHLSFIGVWKIDQNRTRIPDGLFDVNHEIGTTRLSLKSGGVYALTGSIEPLTGRWVHHGRTLILTMQHGNPDWRLTLSKDGNALVLLGANVDHSNKTQAKLVLTRVPTTDPIPDYTGRQREEENRYGLGFAEFQGLSVEQIEYYWDGGSQILMGGKGNWKAIGREMANRYQWRNVTWKAHEVEFETAHGRVRLSVTVGEGSSKRKRIQEVGNFRGKPGTVFALIYFH